MAREAYDSELNGGVILKALATYERTLTSFNSPFDDYYYRGQATLSAEAIKGLDLFMSDETKCSSCHAPPLFTNNRFANIGLYEDYADSGRGRVTFRAEDLGKFKVPTLRNVALTAPYMHDGSMGRLEEVILHFDQGGKAHVHKDARIKPLDLSNKQQEALLAFLKSLTDRSLQEQAK
jgi:cytochrome c peroxidase